jgi:hypothetical protein
LLKVGMDLLLPKCMRNILFGSIVSENINP